MLGEAARDVLEQARPSNGSTATWTRKLDVVAVPSHSTGVNRSGFRISAFAFGQSSRWIVIPRPSEM